MKNYVQSVNCQAVEIVASEEAIELAKDFKPANCEYGSLQYNEADDSVSVQVNVGGEMKKASIGDFLVTYEDGSKKLVSAKAFADSFAAVSEEETEPAQ